MKRLFVVPVLLALLYTFPLAPHAALAQPPAVPTPTPTPAPAAQPTAAPAGQQPPSAALTPLPPQPPDYPNTPEQGVYVSDRAVILSIDSTKLVNRAAAEIFLKHNVPVYIATIRSIEHMGADVAGGVDKYSREVFSRWGVDKAQDGRGILVLYSRGDDQARVLLGSGWPDAAKAEAERIVNDKMLPPIRRNAAGEGLLEGVKAFGVMIDADTAQRFPDRAAQANAVTPYGQPVAPVSQPSSVSWLALGIGVVFIFVIGVVALVLKSRSGGEA